MKDSVALLEKISAQKLEIARLEKKLSQVGHDLAAARRQSRTLESTLSMLPQWVFWLDEQGMLTLANHTFCEAMSLDSPIPVPVSFYEVLLSQGVPSHQVRVIKNNNAEAMATPGTHTYEENMLLGEGKTLLTFKQTLQDQNGQCKGLLCLACDITSRKAAEQSLIAQREQTEREHQARVAFVARLRHDVNAPLSNLSGLLNMLSAQDPVVNDLKHCNRQLENMIGQLFAFTTQRCIEAPMQEDVFSLEDLIEEVQGALSSHLKRQGIEVFIDLPAGLSMMKGNRVRLQRILMNLLNNAIVHAETSRIDLGVQILARRLRIRVRDYGKGLSSTDAIAARRGIRLNHEEEAPSEGLGLRIVQEYLADLRGEMAIDTTVFPGVAFIVELPYESALQEVISEALASLAED